MFRQLSIFVLFGLFSLIGHSDGLLRNKVGVTPKNVIFIIVDGMGFEQIKAARIYLGGKKLAFENFPYQSTVTTRSADNAITDSAAAATAIATGIKVNNATLSMKIPGDGSHIKTILEHFKESGKSTGVVTTALISDATPAAFASHARHRDNTDDILKEMFHSVMPNVIFGADEPHYRMKAQSSAAPYRFVTSKNELSHLKRDVARGALKCDAKRCPYVYGGFGLHDLVPGYIARKTAMPLEVSDESYFNDNDLPHLTEMAETALDVMSQNPKGFFLMIESALVDWIGHKNAVFADEKNHPSATLAIGKEMFEVNRLVEMVQAWTRAHPETLVLLTADHETGGLIVSESETSCIGQQGCTAHAKWTSPLYEEYVEPYAKHTGVDVGVFAFGENAHLFAEPMDNTQFISKIMVSNET